MSKSFQQNVQDLYTSKPGKTRAKGIVTLAKRTNTTRDNAKFHQSVRIAQAQARKGK